MKALCAAAMFIMSISVVFAEITTIGISVTQDNGKPCKVSIYSDFSANNRKNISIEEASEVLLKAPNAGSVVLVGIVANGVPLNLYLPILDAISKNGALQISFVEGDGPEFIRQNIHKMIEPTAVVNP
jgi:hypothetical protein